MKSLVLLAIVLFATKKVGGVRPVRLLRAAVRLRQLPVDPRHSPSPEFLRCVTTSCSAGIDDPLGRRIANKRQFSTDRVPALAACK